MHSLLASFHIVSLHDSPTRPLSPRSLSPYESDDEVVWPLSSSSASAAEPGSQSEASDDDDFVLLNKPRIRKTSRRWSGSLNQTNERDSQSPGQSQNSAASMTPFIDTATRVADFAQAGNAASPHTPGDRTAMATPIPASEGHSADWPANRATRPPAETSASSSISASDARNQRKPTRAARRKTTAQKKEAKAAAAAKATTSEDKEQAKKERRKAARQRRRRRMLQKRLAEVTAKPVPAVAKATSTTPKVIATTTTSPEMYKEASLFITSYLASPVAKRDSVCRLTLLQSLIVELGFMSTALPTTLRAAKNFIKTHVFLNVREYIANRGQGQAAIQRLLFPSRNALIKDIGHKGNRASLQWVKQQGLEVLLVSYYSQ